MHQRPRLGIEDALLVRLIVVRRLAIHLKELLQWQHLILVKLGNVTGDWFAQQHLLVAGYIDRAVILGKPFVKPGGQVGIDTIYKQVDVLVKDNGVGILIALKFGSKRYVVDVWI